MRNTFKLFLERSGQPYQVERDGKIIFTADGLPNHETSTKRQYIGFAPGTDIKPYDWVINSFGERFFIEDTKTIFVQKEPHCLNAYYLTQVEYQKSLQQNSATFNIQNAYGSVIGTQTYVTLNYNDSIQKAKELIETSSSSDKDALNQIISLLEMIVNNQVPVTKGLFSKFSAVMERNSWITGSIMSALLSWLTSQIS